MTLETARAIVTALVRDGSGETTTNVDYAIQVAGRHFCRATRYVKKTDSVAITAASTSFPVTNPLLAGFLPERIIDVWITGEETPVELVDFALLARATARDTSTGIPSLLAFIDNATAGTLWKSPSESLTARLRYWQPFGITVSGTFSESWTAGTSTAATIAGTLNLPDDVIMPVLTEGAASVLKGPSPEKAFESVAWKRFLTYEQQMMGAGNLGARVVYMDGAAAFQSYPTQPRDRINWG